MHEAAELRVLAVLLLIYSAECISRGVFEGAKGGILEKGVVLVGRHVARDQDGDDQRVDSNNTGHDHGNQRLRDGASSQQKGPSTLTEQWRGACLHDQVGSECAHACNAYARLRGAVCCTIACIFSAFEVDELRRDDVHPKIMAEAIPA